MKLDDEDDPMDGFPLKSEGTWVDWLILGVIAAVPIVLVVVAATR